MVIYNVNHNHRKGIVMHTNHTNTEISKNLISWEEINWDFLNQNIYDSTEFNEDGKNPLAKEIVAKLNEIFTDEDGDFLDKIYLHDFEAGENTPEDLDWFLHNKLTNKDEWHTVWEKDYADTGNQTYHYIKVLNDYPETLDYLYVEIGLGGSPSSSVVPFFVKARMSKAQ